MNQRKTVDETKELAEKQRLKTKMIARWWNETYKQLHAEKDQNDKQLIHKQGKAA